MEGADVNIKDSHGVNYTVILVLDQSDLSLIYAVMFPGIRKKGPVYNTDLEIFVVKIFSFVVRVNHENKNTKYVLQRIIGQYIFVYSFTAQLACYFTQDDLIFDTHK